MFDGVLTEAKTPASTGKERVVYHEMRGRQIVYDVPNQVVVLPIVKAVLPPLSALTYSAPEPSSETTRMPEFVKVPDPMSGAVYMDLWRAQQLIRDPSDWCQGAERKDNRRCALRAIADAQPGCRIAPCEALEVAITRLRGEWWSIPLFNDDGKTTHAMVMEAFDTAREIVAELGVRSTAYEALLQARRRAHIAAERSYLSSQQEGVEQFIQWSVLADPTAFIGLASTFIGVDVGL